MTQITFFIFQAQIKTNNKIEVPSSEEFSASIDRKILQTGASESGWINYPERAFEDECGAIKIGPTVQGKVSFCVKSVICGAVFRQLPQNWLGSVLLTAFANLLSL